MKKLSIKRTLADTFSLPFKHTKPLLLSSWIVLVFVAIVDFWSYYDMVEQMGQIMSVQDLHERSRVMERWGSRVMERWGEGDFYLYRYLLAFVKFSAWIMVFVAWISYAVNREPANYGWYHIRLGLREIGCFFALIIVLIITFGLLLIFTGGIAVIGIQFDEPINSVIGVCGLVASLMLCFGLLRFSLLIPMAAMGEFPNPVEAWRLTRGNYWKFTGHTLLLSLLLIGFFIGMAIIFYMIQFGVSLFLGQYSFIVALFFGVIMLLFGVLEIGFIAGFMGSIYRQLVVERDQ